MQPMLLLQAVLLQSPSLYSYHELLSAFTLFADPDGSSGCITYKALKNALVRCLTWTASGHAWDS